MVQRSDWCAELRAAFLALVRETGNQRGAARALGHADLFNNRMKRDAGFRAEVRAAREEADRRLCGARSAFLARSGVEGADRPVRLLPPEEGEGVGGGDGDRGGGGGGENGLHRALTLPPGCVGPPPSPSRGIGDLSVDDLGGYLRPGRKLKQTRPEPVVRRNSRGRWQVTLAREGHMTSDIEAEFLRLLRATGNFSASAQAVGFQAASITARMRAWPAFAADVAEALEEASVSIEYALIGHAHALLRRPGEAQALGIAEEDTPFDPDKAMQIVGFLDRRKSGRTARGPRKGAPARSLDEAVDSVLAKVEAIERHEAMMAKRAAEGGAGGGGVCAQGGEGEEERG